MEAAAQRAAALHLEGGEVGPGELIVGEVGWVG